jgi:hypothetical protein
VFVHAGRHRHQAAAQKLVGDLELFRSPDGADALWDRKTR